jgi:hypothetical protein
MVREKLVTRKAAATHSNDPVNGKRDQVEEDCGFLLCAGFINLSQTCVDRL